MIFYIEGDELVYVGKTHKDKAKHAWLCHINETRYEVIQYEKEDDEQETAGCEVDANAFAGCRKLKEVEISEKAAFVDPDAFAGLQNIKITYF